MNIYQITKEMQNLDDLYMSCIDEETGELQDGEILKELQEEITKELTKKSTNIIKFYNDIRAMADGTKAEIERLQNYHKILEKKQENFKKLMLYFMENTGSKSIQTEVGSITYNTGRESVDIYDTQLIDEKYLVKKITYSVDKKAILKDIKDGLDVQGAKLIKKPFISFR